MAILIKYFKIGYLNVAVDLYIPNPLQCYCCIKFGHNESNINTINVKNFADVVAVQTWCTHAKSENSAFLARIAKENMLPRQGYDLYGRKKKKL